MENKEGKFWAYAMKCIAAGAHHFGTSEDASVKKSPPHVELQI